MPKLVAWIMIPASFFGGIALTYALLNYTYNRKKIIFKGREGAEINCADIKRELVLQDLPESLIVEILSNLQHKELCFVSETCKQLHRIANDQYVLWYFSEIWLSTSAHFFLRLLWQKLFEKTFFEVKYSNSIYWKEYYKQWNESYRNEDDQLLWCCKYGITGQLLNEIMRNNNSVIFVGDGVSFKSVYLANIYISHSLYCYSPFRDWKW